jgi:hypothetical protein
VAQRFLQQLVRVLPMRAVGHIRGARAISLALAAGLLAFEAMLALASGAIGIPGLLLVRFAGETGGSQMPGGESVIAKIAHAESTRTLARLATATPEPSRLVDARDLEGLTELPPDPGWDRTRKTEETGAKAFDADAKGREVLPWDQVEPVPLAPLRTPPTTAAKSHPKSPITPLAAAVVPSKPSIHLPTSGDVEAWVKVKATELRGEDRSRPIYHVELWLEPPAKVKKRLVAVSYDFNTPAVMPQSQVSREEETGFRVSVGGLACADKITVTLKFDDGRTQQVAVDGCRPLG